MLVVILIIIVNILLYFFNPRNVKAKNTFFKLLLFHTFWNFTDRMHVIDSLPLVWMLDGRIITCKS